MRTPCPFSWSDARKETLHRAAGTGSIPARFLSATQGKRVGWEEAGEPGIGTIPFGRESAHGDTQPLENKQTRFRQVDERGAVGAGSCVGLSQGCCRRRCSELWRVDLKNSTGAAYQATVAAVDGQGNVIVGGRVYLGWSGSESVFMAKFDAAGDRVWEFRTGGTGAQGVDGMSVDGNGNVVAAVRPGGDEPWPVVWLKLSPTGQELWRVVETNAIRAGVNTTVSAVATDGTGQVFLLGCRAFHENDGIRNEVFVAKHDPDGRQVWEPCLARCACMDCRRAVSGVALRCCRTEGWRRRVGPSRQHRGMGDMSRSSRPTERWRGLGRITRELP